MFWLLVVGSAWVSPPVPPFPTKAQSATMSRKRGLALLDKTCTTRPYRLFFLGSRHTSVALLPYQLLSSSLTHLTLPPFPVVLAASYRIE
jgi:hypothetical protein